jgi:hypothetical protein
MCFQQPSSHWTAREPFPVPLRRLKIGEGGWVNGQALRTDANGQIWVNPEALAHDVYREPDATIYLQRDEYAWLADLRRPPSRRRGGFGDPQPELINVGQLPGHQGDREASLHPSSSASPCGDWCDPVLRVRS